MKYRVYNIGYFLTLLFIHMILLYLKSVHFCVPNESTITYMSNLECLIFNSCIIFVLYLALSGPQVYSFHSIFYWHLEQPVTPSQTFPGSNTCIKEV